MDINKRNKRWAKQDAQTALELAHASNCVVEAVRRAVSAVSEDDAERYLASAIRFIGTCTRRAWLLELI